MCMPALGFSFAALDSELGIEFELWTIPAGAYSSRASLQRRLNNYLLHFTKSVSSSSHPIISRGEWGYTYWTTCPCLLVPWGVFFSAFQNVPQRIGVL